MKITNTHITPSNEQDKLFFEYEKKTWEKKKQNLIWEKEEIIIDTDSEFKERLECEGTIKEIHIKI